MKLVVRDSATSSNVDVTVNDQTMLVTNNNQPMKLSDLKRGDGVGIYLVGGVAGSIVVNQAVLRGVVDKIDPDEKKMVIVESGTERKVTVPVSSDTTIETDGGKVLDFKQLKTGDGVGISYAGSMPTKVVVNAKPPEVKGHVESVAADLKSLVVKEVGTKADVSLEVTPKTAIVTTSGKTIELKDLKKGDGVGIAHEGSVASKIVVFVAPPN
jgi:hypothetical protein